MKSFFVKPSAGQDLEIQISLMKTVKEFFPLTISIIILNTFAIGSK